MLKGAGMELHKWSASNPLLLPDSMCQVKDLSYSSSTETETLGHLWKPHPDSFSFKISPMTSNCDNLIVTKKLVISTIARIFDPLGLIGPVINRAKILLQSLWQLKLDRNDPLPSNLVSYWKSFIDALESINCLDIPRYCLQDKSIRTELHGFSDSSEKVYGAALYLRCINISGEISVRLLCSKSKVAPLKSITIPRFELCGAVLLSKLLKRTLDAFKELTESDFWKHVNSENNPADILSRGISPDKIQHCQLWWFGPPFLHQYKELEPYDITALEGDDLFLQELKLKETSDFLLCALLKNFEPLDIISNCSSFTKLLRVIAWCAEATLANIRNSFWIPSARNVVRKILRTCITCRKMSAKVSQQLMADLPAARVTACRVFSQAIHLEIVSDLTTEAFLAALKRFVARRGRPIEIHSDNGRNFVGANNELRKNLKQYLRRPKWCKGNVGFKEGDLVLVKPSKNSDSLKWYLARILKLHPGNNTKITVVCIYRPPHGSINTIELDAILNDSNKAFLFGDLNEKHSSWNPGRVNKNGNILCNWAVGSAIDSITPDTPTHFNTWHTNNIFDIGFEANSAHTDVFTINALSNDHNPVIFDFVTNNILPLLLRTLKSTNRTKFQEIIYHRIPGNPQIENLDSAAQNFTNTNANAISASTSTKIINTLHLRLPNNIRELIRAKNRFRKLWNNTRDPPYKREVNALIRQIRKEIEIHTNRTWKDQLLTLNPQDNSLYNLHRKITKRTTVILPLHGPGGMAYSDFKKVEAFKETLEVTFQENIEPYCDDKFEEVENVVSNYFDNFTTSTPPLTSPNEFRGIIKKLQNRKAAVPDQIPNIALKYLTLNAITHLTKIYNQCLIKNPFPTLWKKVNVVMFPKPNQDHKFIQNYRPISLLSTTVKVFERIILKRIQTHCKAIDCIPPEQYGFREGYSTLHQLIRVTNIINEGFANKFYTVGVFLDVKRVFDKMWHDGLTYKLIKLKFPGYIIKIIHSYIHTTEPSGFVKITHSLLMDIFKVEVPRVVPCRQVYTTYTHTTFQNTPPSVLACSRMIPPCFCKVSSSNTHLKTCKISSIGYKIGSHNGELQLMSINLKQLYLGNGV
ncbi:probable RNA-directed DNA polymerase from transposon X-element [Trichonephila clavipes]|nr:probable RNA-directed DNA polymerase from transposon X-element [Trichonephila clavipes]